MGSLRYQPFVHELSLSMLSGFLLHHWVLEKDISSFLVFRGTYFELSQSHFSYAACPENHEPLATSRYPNLVLSLDFARFLMAFLLEI